MAVTESKGTRAVLVAAEHVPNEHVGVRVPVMGCDFSLTLHLFMRGQYRGLLYKPPTYEQLS